ncbi:hypothetical protein DFH08DRAFT_896351 [Mycena albidolilacea]|uniref:Uncharacterized protein n=1 Tax=Mycena albidolilacea TaxID=1033008 RepID=A0AAD6ZAD3_9AGAR|nr:hypothetical protein DFH08DRAFT_896351 [Mycena albidolilacea]
MQWSGAAELNATPLTNITLAGKPIAAVANVKNFTFARVYICYWARGSCSCFPARHRTG